MLLMTLLTYRMTMVTISELSRKWQCLSSIALKIGHFRCTMSSSMQCLDLDVSEVAIFTVCKERTMSVVQIILACFVPPYHHFKWATFVQINFGSIKFLYILTRVRVASVHVPESVSFSSSCWREQRLYCVNDNIYTKEGMTTSNFVRI